MTTYSQNTGADVSGNSDTHLYEGAPTTPQFASSPALDTNAFSAGDIRIGLLRFPVPGGWVPSVVSSASLELYQELSNGSINDIELLECPRTDVVTTQATWNNRATALAWQTAGAQGGLDVGAVIVSLPADPTPLTWEIFSHANLAAYLQAQWNAGLPVVMLLRNVLFSAPNSEYNAFTGSTGADGFRPILNFIATPGAALPGPSVAGNIKRIADVLAGAVAYGRRMYTDIREWF